MSLTNTPSSFPFPCPTHVLFWLFSRKSCITQKVLVRDVRLIYCDCGEGDCGEGDCGEGDGEGDCGEGDCGEGECGEGKWIPFVI